MDTIIPALNIVVFLTLASVHFYWAFGGRWAMGAAVPLDSNGRALFKPGIIPTLAVGCGLASFALMNALHAGWIMVNFPLKYIRYGIFAIAVIFLLRAIGDFRYVGFTKRFRKTVFAQRDTLLYTPLCLLLAFSHGYLLK